MQPGRRRVDERQRAKKLPCGHILHFSCLRSWLERQQVCPTCRRPVLGQPPAANNQNPPNAGQANPAALPIGNLPPAVAAAAAAAQPGQIPPAPQPGQQNQPQGNVRVFNFGPFRVALGNMRLPANQPAEVNNANNNNLLMERLAQQIAMQQNPLNPLPQPQNLNIPHPPTNMVPSPSAGVPQNPNDIQCDILRLQQNIIASIQQLNLQHQQLEHIHTLLAELNRLQQASGAAVNGQDLPPIASLNPLPIPQTNPQAYFSNGSVLRQGDSGMPQGLTLPEGWTLRPMALAPQNATSQTQPSFEASSANTSSTSGTTPRYFSQPPVAPQPLSSTVDRTSGAPPSTTTEPSSLGSSWSFDNAGPSSSGSGAGANTTSARSNDAAEGSSSAVAPSSAIAQGQSDSSLRARTGLGSRVGAEVGAQPEAASKPEATRVPPSALVACKECRTAKTFCATQGSGMACQRCRAMGRTCVFDGEAGPRQGGKDEEDDEEEEDEEEEDEEDDEE